MISIQRTDSENGDFRELVRLLDDYLDKMDKTTHCICEPFNAIDTINYALVIYAGDKAVGCGAIREYSQDTVEIKRMFVLESERRKGIASMILDELEKWAKELGFSRCILETGAKLPDAIALYQTKSYSKIANYGQYECLGQSVCFAKDI
jgi:GNAT superfamily N-acetyltransferase